MNQNETYLSKLEKDIINYKCFSKRLCENAKSYDELVSKLESIKNEVLKDDIPLETVTIEVPIQQDLSRGQRSQKIRDYFCLNPHAKPKEVIKALSQEGIVVSIGLVSSIKTSLKHKGKLNPIDLIFLCREILLENDSIGLHSVCVELNKKGYTYNTEKCRREFVESVQQTLIAMHQRKEINFDAKEKIYSM